MQTEPPTELPTELPVTPGAPFGSETVDAASAEAGLPAPPPVVEQVTPLQLSAHVAKSADIRRRIEQYVENQRWQDLDADLEAPIPVARLAAAVAATPEITDWLIEKMEGSPEQVRYEVENACRALPDAPIIAAVDAALTRLKG